MQVPTVGVAPACLGPPPFERARAAMTYDDVSQNLIFALKHGDRLDLAPLVVSWMYAAGGAAYRRQ